MRAIELPEWRPFCDVDRAKPLTGPRPRKYEMAYLTRTDPTRNINRFYVVDITPTLFGEWALLREWGRRGSPNYAPARRCGTRRAAHDQAPAAARLSGSDMSEADELYEMVNIYPADSGLPMTVWAGPPLAAAHE
jgi:predicted DNA-binding WGR domain protein